MRRIKGMITVEAVILIPVLIIVSMILIYLSAYVYDRSILVQDVNTIAVSARDHTLYGDSLEAVCEEEYSRIKEEHPYLATDNLKLSVVSKTTEVTIGLTGDWTLPIAPSLSRKITYERTVSNVSPITIMFITDKVRATFTEDKDADSDGI